MTVLQHESQTLRRIICCEGQIGRTGTHRSEQGDQQLGRAVEHDAHDIVRSDTLFNQISRQLIRTGIQFAISHVADGLFFSVSQDKGVWRLFDLLINQGHDRRDFDWSRDCGACPLADQLVTFVRFN